MVILRFSCGGDRKWVCCAILDGVQVGGDLYDTRGTVHVGLQVGLVTDGVEVRVAHGLLSSETLL